MRNCILPCELPTIYREIITNLVERNHGLGTLHRSNLLSCDPQDRHFLEVLVVVYCHQFASEE